MTLIIIRSSRGISSPRFVYAPGDRLGGRCVGGFLELDFVLPACGM